MKSLRINGEGDRIRFLDLPGKDTPILFIHGLGCASSYDYPQTACSGCLSSHRRILADLPGFGYSDHPKNYAYSFADHIHCLSLLIEELKLGDFIIFGHSMGGALAVSLAKKYESRVKALIISEGNLDPGGGFLSKRVAAYSLKDYLEYGHEKIIRSSLRAGYTDWVASLRLSDPRAVYEGSVELVKGETPSWRDILYSLPFPRTFIFGEKSLPDEDEHRLRGQGISIEIIKEAGHNMAVENPEGLAGAIKSGVIP